MSFPATEKKAHYPPRWCDTCKHRAIRDACLRSGIEGPKWGKPCRDCDMEGNYLWEAKA